ncbi:MAG: hypothetical protein J4F35_15885 [Candidatus Latescibacteria bacterium]|nr:hypothetical protein [Candidatus Latescibacterota bacterium]
MTEQNNTLSQEEMDFKAWHKAAWEEVKQFRETAEGSFGENDPQHRLAAEIFQTYLEKRPSEIATKALDNAFTMWGNLKGVSDQVLPKMCGMKSSMVCGTVSDVMAEKKKQFSYWRNWSKRSFL